MLPYSALALWLERTCLSACPGAAGSRANLQSTDLSAPKIPSAEPWQGLLQTVSSSSVWLRGASWALGQAVESILLLERRVEGETGLQKLPLPTPLYQDCAADTSAPRQTTQSVSGMKRAVPCPFGKTATMKQAGTRSLGKTYSTSYLLSTKHPQ